MTTVQPPALEYHPSALRQAVRLPDGEVIQVQPLFDRGEAVKFSRAFALPEGIVTVDLRQLVRQLGADLCQALPADVPGLVFWSLRLHFRTMPELHQALREHGTPLRVAP